MYNFYLFSIITFITLLIIFFIIKIAQGIYGFKKLHIFYHATSHNNIDLIYNYLKDLKLNYKDYSFYDLGAGDGRVIYNLSKKLIFKEAIAIDSEFWIFKVLQFKNYFFYKQVLTTIKKDIFEVQIEKPAIIFLYMGYKINSKLYELGILKNSLVITLTFPIDDLIPDKEIKTNDYQKNIYIYKF
jgi:hypothetical protein